MTKVDIDYIVGCSVAAFFIIAFGVLTVLAIRWRRRETALGRDRLYSDAPMALAASIAGPVLILVVIGFFIAGAWPPFNMEYHSYRQVTGTVQDVSTRLLAGDGGGTTQFYAIRFADGPQVYRCDDTRCSLAKPGDVLHLWCIREWQQASTPGYDCNYDSTEAKS